MLMRTELNELIKSLPKALINYKRKNKEPLFIYVSESNYVENKEVFDKYKTKRVKVVFKVVKEIVNSKFYIN